MNRIVLVLFVATAACQSSRDYTVDVAANRVSQLHVIRVRATAAQTEVTFRYDAGTETRRIGVYPVGAHGAFVLTDANSDQAFALTGITGIATLPERTTLRPEAVAKFVLTFEAIPETTTLIHLSEGSYAPEKGESTWQVRNVELR